MTNERRIIALAFSSKKIELPPALAGGKGIKNQWALAKKANFFG
jgi:hypothetical protein